MVGKRRSRDAKNVDFVVDVVLPVLVLRVDKGG